MSSPFSTPAPQPFLLSYRPETDTQAAILIAVTVSLLSYQIIATVADLSFGHPSQPKKISDIQIYLLIRQQSPLAVFRAAFPHASFTKTHTKPDQKHISFHVKLKLVVLLAIPPVVSIISITLPLERDTILSISQSKIAPVATGLHESLEPLPQTRVSPACTRAVIPLHIGDALLHHFTLCQYRRTVLRSLGDSGNYAEVAVRATELALSISIVTPTGTTSVTTLGTLEPVSGNGGNTIPLVVRIDTNEALVEQLVNMGIDEMREWCDNADSKSGEIGVKNPDLSAARTISCFPKKYNETNPAWIQVGKRMGASVTFVRTEKFLVARSRREKIYDTEMVVYDSEPEALWEPRDIPFLRRRRPYVSFWALVFILGIATGLRTVARLFRRNIIARYVEGIVLRVLNVPCCDSLLAHHDAIVNGSFSAKRESCYGQDDDFDSYPQSGVGIDCDEPGDPSQPDQI